MTVPFSNFASPQAKQAFIDNQKFLKDYARLRPDTMTISQERRLMAEHWQPALQRTKELYATESVPTALSGVYTDVITPKEGVSTRNRNRVLINLHGGAFRMDARIMGALESIPVAAIGKIKVVAVDYRQGPEFKFPAASEDVASVYRELLKSYKPQNIGIYGCSAGGVLTAEVVAWIQKEHLPSPGGVGIFCASAAGWTGGDSGSLAIPLTGYSIPVKPSPSPHASLSDAVYFSNADFNDPLVEPIHSPSVLSRFPPTLIITSTRDVALSAAVYSHTQMVKLGVDAELHVWEGLYHAFFTAAPDMPESKEVWQVVTTFFDKHLSTD